ncbi:hypothetical protein [Microbacterium sp. 22242]|uniref:hypothetical protein n=1 Tax=Microbacterium sp. 22242 TaxID=3453896 RepID=UPI003F8597EA
MIRRPLAVGATALAALTLSTLTLSGCATGALPPGAASSPAPATSAGADTQTTSDACAAMTGVLTEVGEDVASIDPAAAAKDPAGTRKRFQADVDRIGAAVDELGNGRIRTAAQQVQAVYAKYADVLTKAVQDGDPAAAAQLLQAPKDIGDATRSFDDLCAAS